MNLLPDAGLGPIPQPAPACHDRTAQPISRGSCCHWMPVYRISLSGNPGRLGAADRHPAWEVLGEQQFYAFP